MERFGLGNMIKTAKTENEIKDCIQYLKDNNCEILATNFIYTINEEQRLTGVMQIPYIPTIMIHTDNVGDMYKLFYAGQGRAIEIAVKLGTPFIQIASNNIHADYITKGKEDFKEIGYTFFRKEI